MAHHTQYDFRLSRVNAKVGTWTRRLWCVVTLAIVIGCSRSGSQPRTKNQAVLQSEENGKSSDVNYVTGDDVTRIPMSRVETNGAGATTRETGPGLKDQTTNASSPADSSIKMLEWIADRDSFRRRVESLAQTYDPRGDNEFSKSAFLKKLSDMVIERVDATRKRGTTEEFEIGTAILEENRRLLDDVRRRRLEIARNMNQSDSKSALHFRSYDHRILNYLSEVDSDLILHEKKRNPPSPHRIKLAEWAAESNTFRLSTETFKGGFQSDGFKQRISQVRDRAFAEQDYEIAVIMLQENKRLLEEAEAQRVADKQKRGKRAKWDDSAIQQADQDLIELAKRRVNNQ